MGSGFLDIATANPYGAFLEVAFALNLISTWDGFYKNLSARAQNAEDNASSDETSQRLVSSQRVWLRRLKWWSKRFGFILSCLIFIFLLYGLPTWQTTYLMLLLWLCGGTMPSLALVMFWMVRYYYVKIRRAKEVEDRRQEADQAAALAKRRADEELLTKLEREGRIVRLDKNVGIAHPDNGTLDYRLRGAFIVSPHGDQLAVLSYHDGGGVILQSQHPAINSLNGSWFKTTKMAVDAVASLHLRS